MSSRRADVRHAVLLYFRFPLSLRMVEDMLVTERMHLFIRAIGIARATTKIGMASLVYNFKRLLFVRRTEVAP